MLAAVLAAASLVGIVFHGASAGGFGLGDALSWDVFTAVLDTRFGEVWLVRAGLAAGLALVAFSGVHPGFLLPFAVGLAWTLPASGHANTAGALAFVMDLLHVLAASVWAGGLTFVLLALILARTNRWSLAAAIVPRFSALAVASVAVLLVGGLVNGYLEVRAWSGLWETNYGRLLLAKSAIVVVLLAIGAYNNRRAVPRLERQAASAVEQRRFLGAVGIELALFAVAIGVTAVLVDGAAGQGDGRSFGAGIALCADRSVRAEPRRRSRREGTEQHPSVPTEAERAARQGGRGNRLRHVAGPGNRAARARAASRRSGPLQRARGGAATRR